MAGGWSWAGPLLGVGRGPGLPERIGRERIGSQWGKGFSSNHKYKFYSRSLSPFVFLGGLRAMSALCMSNSRSAPPGCMMDGSGKAGLSSCQSPLQSLRPHPPYAPLLSLHPPSIQQRPSPPSSPSTQLALVPITPFLIPSPQSLSDARFLLWSIFCSYPQAKL